MKQIQNSKLHALGWNHQVCLEGEIKYLAEVLK
jgi:hypothetical protein